MKIIQDSREQAPYAFNAPRYAGTVVEVGTLQTGDYSLHGLTDRIALERKSLSDLCGTLTAGRERFKRECERGRGLEYFGLVIEASMRQRLVGLLQNEMTDNNYGLLTLRGIQNARNKLNNMYAYLFRCSLTDHSPSAVNPNVIHASIRTMR